MSAFANKHGLINTAPLLFFLASLLLPEAAFSQDENARSSSNHKQLAMSLPSVPRAAVQKAPFSVPCKKLMSKQEPEIEFASHHGVPPVPARPENNADKIKDILIDGASKAEMASRSYNRRVADLIVWFASSMKQSGRISPASSQMLRRQAPLETVKSRPDSQILQID